MMGFLYSLGKLILLFVAYKLSFVCFLLFIRYSPYNRTGESYQNDYGQNGERKVVLIGASNTRFNFDYERLNSDSTGYTFRSSACSGLYGMYLTLEYAQNNVDDNDVPILDAPYAFYTENQFLPANKYVFGKMTMRDYLNVFHFSKKSISAYLLQVSPFNNEVLLYLRGVYENYGLAPKKLAIANKRPGILPRQDFDRSYFECSLPYIKKDHYTLDIVADTSYFLRLHSYIKNKFNHIRFMYPELNRGNNSISPKTECLFKRYFKPVNNFEKSLFEDKLEYDSHYHLNKCGTERNTDYLYEALTNAGVLAF